MGQDEQNAQFMWLEEKQAESDQETLRQMLEEKTEQLREQNEQLQLHNESLQELLQEIIVVRNTESGQHIHAVMDYTEILAKTYATLYPKEGMTPDVIECLVKASAMHDFGKILMPDGLIKKQGRLLPEEMNYLKEHTIKGCRVIDAILPLKEEPFYQICMDVCRYHHERYDGTGFPEGLKGDEIPISAQIVGLADMYDIMMTEGKRFFKTENVIDLLLRGACGELSPKMQKCLKASKQKLEEVKI